MEVRKTAWADLEAVLAVYACARERMKRNGNPTQWGDRWPPRQVVEGDIENGTGYVVVEEGTVLGAFALLPGPEPSYQEITGGQWREDGPYSVIHRLAAGEGAAGVFACCLDYCERHAPNLRMDTHRDNSIMRHLLEKHGYEACGTLLCPVDGTERIAYQKRKPPQKIPKKASPSAEAMTDEEA